MLNLEHNLLFVASATGISGDILLQNMGIQDCAAGWLKDHPLGTLLYLPSASTVIFTGHPKGLLFLMAITIQSLLQFLLNCS